MSRAQLTSTVEQNTGGAVSPYVAGKNAIINGAFNVWQRGTSFSFAASTANNTYCADRWVCSTGANQAITISRQATNDTTNLPFIQYCARYQRNSGQTGTTNLVFGTSLESASSIPYAGKQVTLSFYARAGANYSAASSALYAILETGTGTDQNIYGMTGTLTPINNAVTLTTTWQRFTLTATLASNVTQLGMYFIYVPVGTAGTNDYYEVTGVQVEAGSVATPFTTATGTLSGELAACKRYFQKTYGANEAIGTTNTGSVIWTQIEGSETSRVLVTHQFPVEMRTSPTVTGYGAVSGSSGVWYNRSAAADRTITSLGTSPNGIAYNTISGTNTAGQQVLVCYTASAEL